MTNQQFERCIEQIIQRDKSGLQMIYEEYSGMIYTTAFSMVKSKESAEDITSDFFIKLWSGAGYYKKGGAHKGWMATIARNMAIDYLRKKKREISLEETVNQTGETYADREAANLVEDTVIGELTTQEMLQTLSDGEQQVVSMKILGDMTFKEIARVLKQPIGTITWRYQNAMKKMRKGRYDEA